MSVFSDDDDFDEPAFEKGWKSQIKKFWHVIIAGIAILFFHGKYGIWSYDIVVFYSISFVIFISLMNAIYDKWKLNTPNFICNPIHTTTSGIHYDAGSWVIFRKGDVDSGNWKFPGKEGSIIIPKNVWYIAGRNIYAPVNVHPTSFEELPIDVKAQIIHHNLPKPYFFGIADENSFPTMPDLTKQFEEIKNLNAHISMLEEIIKKTRVQLEGHHSMGYRLKRFAFGRKDDDEW